MQVHLLAVGQKMPAWVKQACDEYQKRLPTHLKIRLKEIAPAHRSGRYNPEQARAEECQRLRTALPKDGHLVMLDVDGKAWSTEQLAGQLARWQEAGRPLVFTIGGPDGYSEDFRVLAQQRWSLGPLTLPHPLVRVVLYEQLYRAHTLLIGHPYHRG